MQTYKEMKDQPVGCGCLKVLPELQLVVQLVGFYWSSLVILVTNQGGVVGLQKHAPCPQPSHLPGSVVK